MNGGKILNMTIAADAKITVYMPRLARHETYDRACKVSNNILDEYRGKP